jgi:hypothetical protein
MPWQEGLRWWPRRPSLLKCLFIVMTGYSSNGGGGELWGQCEKWSVAFLDLEEQEKYLKLSQRRRAFVLS